MTDRQPALSPYPLSLLLGRIAREFSSRGRIFDLPAAKFFRNDSGCDLSVQVAGRRVGTPAGPAAGPHTQLAQNIVLGWLAGGRTFELKTVQILDQLEIDRPCIDMQTVGFNVEWSQELTLEQSLQEYVKAWLMLAVLRRWEPLAARLGDPGEVAFELSVGYDLAGVQSDRLTGFIASVRDATAVIDELRPQIPAPFARFAEDEFSPRVVDSATISTFHGCPPEEIEAIARHLMEAHDLDVTVKLNPTLLGRERVQEILQAQLGFTELQLVPEAFAEDLSPDRARELIASLERFARERGRTFGIKLTNTLVVENHKGWLPGERMYLSGPPLHVLAITLLDELESSLPGRLQLGTRTAGVPVAFSAGIDKRNFSAAAGLGLVPVTICSDLLKPGGYGRLAPMLKTLATAMQETGCADLPAWRRHQEDQAVAAGHGAGVAAYAARLAGPEGRRRYGRKATGKLPRTEPRELTRFDCSSCNLCVTVCPNDAMLRLATPPALADILLEKWQYLCLAELCNRCGNCVVFCPEQGDPCRVKPQLYVQADSFARREEEGFLLGPGPGAGDRPFVVTASPGVQDAGEMVAVILNGPKGLPWPPENLPEGPPA